MSGVLYLVATPIGNLGDMSQRMIDTLREVHFIAAEDTRVTVKLLNHLNIKKTMLAYHRHNSGRSGLAIVERIEGGEDCALVSDAGTPAISDPGEELVALCEERGIEVISIPGPCALVSALALSGLPTGRFCFEGFLAMNKKNRRAHLKALREEERTMIFYEAPHKLPSTLRDLEETFEPSRRISICRELTKRHEEVWRTTLGEARAWYEEYSPKGEFVLVVEGGTKETPSRLSLEEAWELVRELLNEGSSIKDAVRRVAEQENLSRKELYNYTVKAVETDRTRRSNQQE